jgi:energy-coupling factor transporter ATP-binding protein EcfA2
MITHDVEFVAESNPVVVLLSKGRIVAQGNADKVLSREDVVDKASLVKPQMARLFAGLKEYGMPREVIDVHRARLLLEDKLMERVKVHVS